MAWKFEDAARNVWLGDLQGQTRFLFHFDCHSRPLFNIFHFPIIIYPITHPANLFNHIVWDRIPPREVWRIRHTKKLVISFLPNNLQVSPLERWAVKRPKDNKKIQVKSNECFSLLEGRIFSNHSRRTFPMKQGNTRYIEPLETWEMHTVCLEGFSRWDYRSFGIFHESSQARNGSTLECSGMCIKVLVNKTSDSGENALL